MKLIHPISPVPAPLWGVNLRKRLKQKVWSKLRAALIEERGLKCEICHKAIDLPRNLKAHEDWDYDPSTDPAVARLVKITLSCWHCHAIEHFGAIKNMVATGALSSKAIDDTVAHFCELNSATIEEFEEHHESVFEVWSQHNNLRWVVEWGPYANLASS